MQLTATGWVGQQAFADHLDQALRRPSFFTRGRGWFLIRPAQ
jgi:hypothetical protein